MAYSVTTVFNLATGQRLSFVIIQCVQLCLEINKKTLIILSLCFGLLKNIFVYLCTCTSILFSPLTHQLLTTRTHSTLTHHTLTQHLFTTHSPITNSPLSPLPTYVSFFSPPFLPCPRKITTSSPEFIIFEFLMFSCPPHGMNKSFAF